jgi:carboxypeptidase T
VTSTDPRSPLARLVTLPLGLDVWELTQDEAVLQADEAQAARLQAMGYGVDQLQTSESYVADFDTARTAAGYHSAESLEEELRHLADDHPEIAQLQRIGRGIEGRPILALRIGERRRSARRVAFLGCHHAREWISVEVPFLLAKDLLADASTAPVRDWLQQGEVWVVPMVNPDGHEHTRTPGNRLWRKNRRRNRDGTIGVDLNRNYGYMWGTLDVTTSSHTPADDTYVGPRAFSEPESRAVRDLVARQLFGGVLTYHSYSQLILYPWGNERSDPRRGGPARDARSRRRHAAADRRRARRDLHRAAVVAALSHRGGHHGLDLRRVRRALVHRRAATGVGAGGRVHPPVRPDPAVLGGEPAGGARLRPSRAGEAGALSGARRR